MELLSVGLMSEHVRFQTVTLCKAKFTYLNHIPDSEMKTSDEHLDSLCIDTDVRLESTGRDQTSEQKRKGTDPYEHVNVVSI